MPDRSPPDRVVRQSVVAHIVQPLQEFVQTEVAGGVMLLAAAVVAVVWANSPWSDSYQSLLSTHVAIDLSFYSVDRSLQFWVNDVAMVLFFFLVGLEIKRELVHGELRSLRRAAMPLAAAIGGMIVPVTIFAFVVHGPEARSGWGVPMATDIAFALGVVALIPRVPIGLKILLLAIAIFDDIGAVAVIALFYTADVRLDPLLIAGAVLVVIWILGRLGVWRLPVYILLGLVAWTAVLKSGVHPTIVGVVLGLLTPARAAHPPEQFVDETERLLADVYGTLAAHDEQEAEQHRAEALLRLRRLADLTVTPLDRLEHSLNRWVAFLIVPLFALANAGVDLRGDILGDALTSRLAWGVGVGLVVGKPVGIVVGCWIAQRVGAELPNGVGWRGVIGVGAVAGIGFTVALFVTELAYPAGVLLTQAKVGIFGASLMSATVGYLLLRGQPDCSGANAAQTTSSGPKS